MKESKFIECECHSEIIKVEQFDGQVYISLYVHGDYTNYHPSFWTRIKDTWRILYRRKYPDYAEVVISVNKAKSLGGWLLNCD